MPAMFWEAKKLRPCPKACSDTLHEPVAFICKAFKAGGIDLIFRELYIEHNPREIGSAFQRASAETCPPHRQRHLRPADWAKRPFMDGYELVV